MTPDGVVQVGIANGGTTSDTIDLRQHLGCMIEVPTLTSCDLTIEGKAIGQNERMH